MPRSVPEECPAEVAALIERCCSPDPAQRPDAAECAAILAQFLPAASGAKSGVLRTSSGAIGRAASGS
jgi:hypothetical protein